MKIDTHRAHVPWSWVVWMVLPWFNQQFADLCNGAPLVFTMRKFIADPVLIGFLSSLQVGFNFIIGVGTSYASDRIWTRWGRRRPFLILGWVGAGMGLVLLPLAPNIWSVVAVIIFYQFCVDFAKPYEPLYNEVIPPPQRGRASIFRNILLSANGMLFNAVLLAQFDRKYDFGRLELNGEKVLYWTGAILFVAAAAFLVFRVHENPPPGGIHRERLSVRGFVRDVFCERQWLMLYLLYSCPGLIVWSVSTYLPLFQTEQLGFSKATVGHVLAGGMVVNLVFFVPLVGFLADRFSRLRLFQIGLIAPGLVNTALFVYTRYWSHGILSLTELACFAILAAGMQNFFLVVWGPLMYDYIPSSRFGTVSAGFSFASGLASFLFLNLAGFWVKGFTHFFGSFGGSAFDYSSILVFQAITGVVALAYALHFGREVKSGRIVAYANLEPELPPPAPVSGLTAPGPAID